MFFINSVLINILFLLKKALTMNAASADAVI